MKGHPQAPYFSYNPYFLWPFILWVIAGGIVQLLYDPIALFVAINGKHTPFLDTFMYAVTRLGEGASSVLILLILFALPAFRNWWYFTAAVVSNILPSVVVTQLLKSAVAAPRPMRRLADTIWIHHLPEWPLLMERSFPSGHTCAAFSLCCFLAFLLPPKRRAWGAGLFILALLTAYSRIYLAAHFFADIYAGSIIGVVFVALTFKVMHKYAPVFFSSKSETKAH